MEGINIAILLVSLARKVLWFGLCICAVTFSMLHTLYSISNACSNYKIPEGLVINRADVLSRPENEALA